MRGYELLFILPPDVDEERSEALVNRIRSIIEDQNGSVENVDEWGRRRLAYEIDGHRDGGYTLVEFTLDTQSLPELEHALRINQDVLRHLVVRQDET